MTRRSALTLSFGAVMTACRTATGRDESKFSLESILQEYVIARNGEIIADIRKSAPERWHGGLKNTTRYRYRKLPSEAYRYILIQEFNRYHSVFLDRDLRLIFLETMHVEGPLLEDSGPEWKSRRRK